MKCVNGHTVPNEARFCGECGSAIVERFQPGAVQDAQVFERTTHTGRGFPLLTSLKSALLEDLVGQRTFRLAITPQNILATASGILISLSFVSMSISWLVSGSDSSTAGATLWAVSGILIAYLGVRLLDFRFMHAVSTLAAICITWTPIAAFTDAFARRQIGLPMILSGLVAIILWSLPGFRARPIMLTLSLISIPLGVAALLSENPRGFDSVLERFADSGFNFSELITGFSNGTFYALLLFGLTVLIFAFRFEIKNWTNIASSFIGAGTTLLLIGAFGTYSSAKPVVPSISLIFGTALLIAIGNVHTRRATLITSGILVTFGLIFAIGALLPNASSTASLATLLSIFGVGIGAISISIPKYLSMLQSKENAQ